MDIFTRFLVQEVLLILFLFITRLHIYACLFTQTVIVIICIP